MGAANIKEAPAGAVFSDKIDGIGEFSPQHRLGAAIVRVAIRMPPGEIVAGIVGAGIKNARLRSAEAALGALQNVAAILGIEEALRRRLSASGQRSCVGLACAETITHVSRNGTSNNGPSYRRRSCEANADCAGASMPTERQRRNRRRTVNPPDAVVS